LGPSFSASILLVNRLNKDYSNLAKDGITFVFGSWQQQFVLGFDQTPYFFPPGARDFYLTQCVAGLHKCTNQLAFYIRFKAVKTGGANVIFRRSQTTYRLCEEMEKCVEIGGIACAARAILPKKLSSQSYGASPATWNRHTVTCHPTQIHAPHVNPSQIGQ